MTSGTPSLALRQDVHDLVAAYFQEVEQECADYLEALVESFRPKKKSERGKLSLDEAEFLWSIDYAVQLPVSLT